jgi:hypothetical protein
MTALSIRPTTITTTTQPNRAVSGGREIEAAPYINGLGQATPVADASSDVVPSTIVNISEAGRVAHQALAQTQQGAVDPTLAMRDPDPNAAVNKPLRIYTLHVPEAEAKYHALNAQETTTYYARPMEKSQEALDTMHIQLGALQKSIQAVRPSLADQSWGFVLKWDAESKDSGPKDGKIEVTGVSNAQDKKWLEDRLNGDEKILKGVKDFYSAVETFYEHTPEHPSQTVQQRGIYTGYVQDVAKQINGSLNVKSLIDKSFAEGGRVSGTGRPYFGDVLFDKVGSQLVSTTKATHPSLMELAWQGQVTEDAKRS